MISNVGSSDSHLPAPLRPRPAKLPCVHCVKQCVKYPRRVCRIRSGRVTLQDSWPFRDHVMQLRSYWKTWIEGWILVPHIPDQALDCIQLKPNQDGEKMWVLLPSTRSHLWEIGISTIFLRKYKSWTTHLCFHSGKDWLLIPARKKPSRYSFSGALLSLKSIFTWEEIDGKQFKIIGKDLNHRITGTSKALYGYIGSISNQKWEVLLGEHSAKCLFQKNWITDLTGFERPLESVSSPSDQKWEVILGEYPAPRRSWKIHPQPFHIISLCLQPHVNLTLSSETIQEALRIRKSRFLTISNTILKIQLISNLLQSILLSTFWLWREITAARAHFDSTKFKNVFCRSVSSAPIVVVVYTEICIGFSKQLNRISCSHHFNSNPSKSEPLLSTSQWAT